MTRGLALLAGATAFLLCILCVKDHAALVRAGYRATALDQDNARLQMETARLREAVSRLGSPAVLAQQAEELGLSTEYPPGYLVVRIGGGARGQPLVVKVE